MGAHKQLKLDILITCRRTSPLIGVIMTLKFESVPSENQSYHLYPLCSKNAIRKVLVQLALLVVVFKDITL